MVVRTDHSSIREFFLTIPNSAAYRLPRFICPRNPDQTISQAEQSQSAVTVDALMSNEAFYLSYWIAHPPSDNCVNNVNRRLGILIRHRRGRQQGHVRKGFMSFIEDVR